MSIQFFKSPAAFRKWLEKNHQKEKECIVGYYKKETGKQCMTWSESVDEALCYGWIDGIRKSVDAESYCNRFTPRRPKSIWSDINIKKVEMLIANNKMQSAGLAAFEKRDEAKSRIYSFENDIKHLAPAYEKIFQQNKKAWEFYKKQAPSYQKVIQHWIMTAKQEHTQLSRLEKTIAASALQKRL